MTTAYASFIFGSLSAPPKADEIGEIKFDRSDTPINNSEAISLSRDEFIRYFREGSFFNDGKSIEWVYRSDHFKNPLNSKGGWMYCSGAFATKDGRIFTFNRPRVGVIEISDAKYNSGFLVLPEYK